LWALVMLGVLVLAAVVVLDRSANHPAPAPAWLANRPIGAALSPYMAAECRQRHCHANSASAQDLNVVRGLLDPSAVVEGLRVHDAHDQLRGVRVWAMDADADQVSINAVLVGQPPAGWDGQAATLGDDSWVSRWVLHTRSGTWLAEAKSTSNPCADGNSTELAVLTGIALTRVRAAELHL
jgi:hypothetical protein